MKAFLVVLAGTILPALGSQCSDQIIRQVKYSSYIKVKVSQIIVQKVKYSFNIKASQILIFYYGKSNTFLTCKASQILFWYFMQVKNFSGI